jgi:integrase
MAEGIRKLHSKGCPAKQGKRCRCNAGWEAAVYIARDGKRKTRTFPLKSEAESWRAEAHTAVRGGKLRARSTRLTVEQAAWLWLEAAISGKARNRSGEVYRPAPLREYARVLRLRVLPEFRHRQLGDLPQADVQAFVDGLLADGLAASTVRNTIDPLRAIYRHALKRGLVAVNPTREVELPAADGRRERIASPTEATRLLDALPAADRPIWATAFYAGLRCGELQALRVCDIDLGRSEVHVRRAWDRVEGSQQPKSKAGTRTVPMLAILRDYLDARLLAAGRSGDDLVFGRTASEPFSPRPLAERADEAWGDAGLDRITLHECRHTYASLLIDAGVNPKAIQEFMGHATIQVTFDTYGKLMPGSREQARELMDTYLDAAEQEARAEAAAAGSSGKDDV